MTRILLFGATGQVGQELVQTLAPLGEVMGVDRNQVDLAQPEAIAQLIQSVQPEIIVNAAAYTAVDKAESEPDLAIAINATAPQVMAEQAQALGSTLIHISTDYVFDGTQSRPYLESDPPQPLGVYGESKLWGEKSVREACDRHVILRTAWVYGSYGKANFVKTMLRLGAEREELRVVADQIGSPTWAKDLADAIAQLIPKLTPDSMGTYHCTNSGVASWYDFAVAIFEEAATLGFPLKVQRVIPIRTEDYPTLARRPAFSVLSGTQLASVLGHSAPHWRQALRHMLKEYYESTDSLRR